MSDASLDHLLKEYSAVFRDFDDQMLARWLCQTLGQIQGRVWRLSHPLLGTYRLAAQTAHERQIWLKRLATPPPTYWEASCCRAPLLPLLTRDVLGGGLICQHCGDVCVPLEDMPGEVREPIRRWAEEYGPVHAVAHWEDSQRRTVVNYEQKLDEAAHQTEQLLRMVGQELAPKMLEYYPAIIWEDQDDCLEVRPEDITF